MTLSARHRITWLLFSLSLILNGAVFYFLISRYSLLETIHPLSTLRQSWWLNSEIMTFGNLRQIILSYGIAAGVLLSGTLSLNLAFRRSSSQEIFYFQLFLLCLSLVSIRLYSYVIQWYRLPFAYTVLLSRTVLFFRFGSLLFLLLSGLSVFDSRFQKSDPFFLAALLFSLGLATTIPMGDRFVGNTLTYLPVSEAGLFGLFLIVKLIIPINFLWFVYQRKTVDYIILTGATMLCITGESMIFYMSFLNCFLGLIALGAGAFLFSHRIYKLYLWR